MSGARPNGMPFSQDGYRCRLEWGRQGAQRAAERGDVLVVVDVLRFSTAVVAAVAAGGIVYPCASDGEDPEALARRVGGEVAGRDRRFSLSPLSYRDLKPGALVVLPSPNGAACCRADVPHLFVGALVNAGAVGAAAHRILSDEPELDVTALACGEREPGPAEDGALRFAIEDTLGAGAILSCLPFSKSPEAGVCEAAFKQIGSDLEAAIWECGSGRELRARGWDADVRHAARFSVCETVPVMRGKRLEAM